MPPRRAPRRQPPEPRRARLDRAVRMRMIVEGAAHFFAEHGIGARTKDLARAVGVSEGLIFRYFGTKQGLVAAVFDRVFVQRWSGTAERVIGDRARPLAERLETFYLSYYGAIDEYDWIRITLFAGLAGDHGLLRQFQTKVEGLLGLIAVELRHARGETETGPITPEERERVWHLHSTFIYALVRRYVLGLPVADDREAFVRSIVDAFLNGALARRPPS